MLADTTPELHFCLTNIRGLTALTSIFIYHIRHAIYRCLIFEMSVSLEVLNHVSVFHWTGLVVKNNSMLKNRFLAKFES